MALATGALAPPGVSRAGQRMPRTQLRQRGLQRLLPRSELLPSVDGRAPAPVEFATRTASPPSLWAEKQGVLRQEVLQQSEVRRPLHPRPPSVRPSCRDRIRAQAETPAPAQALSGVPAPREVSPRPMKRPGASRVPGATHRACRMHSYTTSAAHRLRARKVVRGCAPDLGRRTRRNRVVCGSRTRLYPRSPQFGGLIYKTVTRMGGNPTVEAAVPSVQCQLACCVTR
jgi:hypothetical protein